MIVQEQIGHGSAMKGLKDKAWTESYANFWSLQFCTCMLYVSDKPEHGAAEQCRGAKNNTAKFSGQCCSCRFGGALNSVANCMTKRHSCCACKAWQRYYRGEMEAAVRASMERMMQREMVSLRSFDVRSTMVINTDASLQGAGISWREHRRAMSTPQRQTRQIRKMLALRLYSSREGQDVVQGA